MLVTEIWLRGLSHNGVTVKGVLTKVGALGLRTEEDLPEIPHFLVGSVDHLLWSPDQEASHLTFSIWDVDGPQRLEVLGTFGDEPQSIKVNIPPKSDIWQTFEVDMTTGIPLWPFILGGVGVVGAFLLLRKK